METEVTLFLEEKSQRGLSETGCRRGPQYDRNSSFYFNYFFSTTPTNLDLRQKAVYFPARVYIIPEAWNIHTVIVMFHYSSNMNWSFILS